MTWLATVSRLDGMNVCLSGPCCENSPLAHNFDCNFNIVKLYPQGVILFHTFNGSFAAELVWKDLTLYFFKHSKANNLLLDSTTIFKTKALFPCLRLHYCPFQSTPITITLSLS